MTSAMELYPFNYPKRTECNICYAEKWCLPCGVYNACDVYTCSECRIDTHYGNYNEDINEMDSHIYKCPYCCGKDTRNRLDTLIIYAHGILGDADEYDDGMEEYRGAVGRGECCIIPSGPPGIQKWRQEKIKKMYDDMTRDELLNEIYNISKMNKDLENALETVENVNKRLVSDFKTMKVSLGTLQNNIPY